MLSERVEVETGVEKGLSTVMDMVSAQGGTFCSQIPLRHSLPDQPPSGRITVDAPRVGVVEPPPYSSTGIVITIPPITSFSLKSWRGLFICELWQSMQF